MIAIGVLSFFIFKDYEVAKPEKWSLSVSLRSNAFTSSERVIDSASGATLFYYSVDPEIIPVSVDKIDNETWTVTFKSRAALQKDVKQ